MSPHAYIISTCLEVLKNRERELWDWEHNKEQDYWEVKYHGVQPMFSFRIELGVHMIYFHATLEQLVIYRSNYEALCRYVLRLNEELNAAKFGLTPDGFVSLMIDWHIEDVSIAELEQAIKLLVSYYRLYYPDIQLVAQDITLNAQMLKLIARGKLIETDMGIRLDESSA